MSYVSASQIKRWQACPRKWGYLYLDKIPDPPGAAAQLGTEVHSILELYYRDGAAPPNTRAGKLAAALLPLYSGLEVIDVERTVDFQVDGVRLRGIVDLIAEGVIVDHKTSSNPRRYGLAAGEHLRDPAALIYAWHTMRAEGWDHAEARWGYVATRGARDAFAVCTDLQRDQVDAALREHVIPVAREILEVGRKAPHGEALEARPEACSMFGGCPYASFCPRTLNQTLDSVFTQQKGTNDMSLIDRLKQRKKAPPRVNAPEAPAPEIQVAASKKIGAGLKAKVSRERKKQHAQQVAETAAQATTVEEFEGATEAPERPEINGIDDVLHLAQNNGGEIVLAKSKSDPEHPWIHGKTLNKAARDGRCEVIEDCPAKGLRTVRVPEAPTEAPTEAPEAPTEAPEAPEAPDAELRSATLDLAARLLLIPDLDLSEIEARLALWAEITQS